MLLMLFQSFFVEKEGVDSKQLSAGMCIVRGKKLT